MINIISVLLRLRKSKFHCKVCEHWIVSIRISNKLKRTTFFLHNSIQILYQFNVQQHNDFLWKFIKYQTIINENIDWGPFLLFIKYRHQSTPNSTIIPFIQIIISINRDLPLYCLSFKISHLNKINKNNLIDVSVLINSSVNIYLLVTAIFMGYSYIF